MPWYLPHNMTLHQSFRGMFSREISVFSNLVSCGKRNPARFLKTVILCEAFCGNLQLHQISQCPLQQKFLRNNILYQANITPLDENSESKVYYGIWETKFQLRYTNHKKSLNHRNRKSDTELSNEFWRIKDNKHNANITWEILGRHQAYNTSSKRCSLCLNEKLKIALHRNNNMLNRRTEMLNKCRNKNKYARISYNSKD